MTYPGATDPMESKLILAFVSTILAWGVKAVWDEFMLRRRWRRLAPLILRQLHAVAHTCKVTFDVQALPRISTKLASAQNWAIQLVEAGVWTNDWLTGLEHIADCLDLVHASEAASAAGRVAALSDLRKKADDLCRWTMEMQGRAHH